jgi:hypothetical protein
MVGEQVPDIVLMPRSNSLSIVKFPPLNGLLNIDKL